MHVGDIGDVPEGDRLEAEVDDLGDHLTQRRDEIAERIRQLAERRRELANRPNQGSSPEDLDRARASAAEAQEHARDAHARAAVRHDLASEAHLRAAAMLDRQGRSDRAERHRTAAAEDRASGEADRDAARDA